MTKMATATICNSSRAHLLGKGKSEDLEKIIKECVGTETNWGLMQNDVMFAVAFWSMVKCGFEPISEEEKPLKDDSTLPKNWKHEFRQLYEAQFILPPYFEYPVKLLALPADDILCINILVSNISPRNISLRSLAIHSTGYVTRPDEERIRCKFSGLEDFHFLLKNDIIWPIRCSILTDQGIMNGSLCGLSDEIKLKIVKNLTVKEVIMLSQTCHDLNRICNDQRLWKALFHEHFKNACKCGHESKECDEIFDWKENYKQVYCQQKQTRSSSTQGSPSESYHTAVEAPYGSDFVFEFD